MSNLLSSKNIWSEIFGLVIECENFRTGNCNLGLKSWSVDFHGHITRLSNHLTNSPIGSCPSAHVTSSRTIRKQSEISPRLPAAMMECHLPRSFPPRCTRYTLVLASTLLIPVLATTAVVALSCVCALHGLFRLFLINMETIVTSCYVYCTLSRCLSDSMPTIKQS